MEELEKLPIAKKAYKIDFDKIYEGFMCCEEVCVAKNVNEAKSKLFRNVYNYGYKRKYSDEELTYLTIPVIRAKEYDHYHFEGGEITRLQMIERRRIQALDAILKNDSIKYCYIMKRGDYYRPNSCGYTGFKARAGVYTKEEAVSDAKSCSELYLEIIDIEIHNKMLIEEITEMQSRILKVNP